MTDWPAFGAWIREQREARGLTCHGVERRGGPSASVVKYIEEADLGPDGPRVDTLVKLAGALELDVDSLLVRAGQAPMRAELQRDVVAELLEVVAGMSSDEMARLVESLRSPD